MEYKTIEYTYANGMKETFHYTITKKIERNMEIYLYSFEGINYFWHSIGKEESESTIYDKLRSVVERNK